MSIRISPFGNSQFFKIDGSPAVGYQLFTYRTRSTEKIDVFSDADGNAKHTNPIILNAHGLPPSPIYIDSTQSYRFTLAIDADEDPPTIPLYVVDDIELPVTAQQGTQEWVAGPPANYIAFNQFSVAGNQTSIFHIGRRVRATMDSFVETATITLSSFNGTDTIVTIFPDALFLDSTLSSISYGFLSAQFSSWPGGKSTNGIDITFAGNVSIGIDSSLDIMDAGTIMAFAGTSNPPLGWLRCNGQAVSRTQRAYLFSWIGTTYGVGDGVTTFNLPNIPNLVTTTVSIPYNIRY